MFLFWIGGG
ncbi:hypothetical protein LINGRAPRIM_LOCUS372 [Linum grandiflorum]